MYFYYSIYCHIAMVLSHILPRWQLLASLRLCRLFPFIFALISHLPLVCLAIGQIKFFINQW